MSRAANILVVDDEPNVRLVFRTALEAPGRTVTTVADGEAALARVSEVRCDLVVLDLQMPGMDGMEVLQRLRDRGEDVPVLIVTAHGGVPDAVRALRLGAIDFLAKPLTPEALRRAVDDVLERHAKSPAATAVAVTAASQCAENLTRAKRALNHRAFEEAEVFLEQALALDPCSAEAHNLLGVVHESRSEFKDAYRAYKAALKADRTYAPAEHNLKRHAEWHLYGGSDVPIDTGPP